MPKLDKEEGFVKILNGKYHLKGSFHIPEANKPIFNENTLKLAGITNPRDMTYIHSYGGEAIFFESLSRRKLLATRCNNDKCEYKGTIYLPFRTHCPDCLNKMEVLDFTDQARQTAKIHSFIITHRSGAFNSLKIPIKFINVEFENVATILMSYLSEGEPEIGKSVLPIFRTKDPTYTITDLSFVVKEISEKNLPDGFSF